MAQQKYIALLRGINVGGNKKVPMADLKNVLFKTGATEITTILNSGNIVFEMDKQPEASLELELSQILQDAFGFPIPVILRTGKPIINLLNEKPFKNIPVTPETRLYVSFLKDKPSVQLKLPWATEDGAFTILQVNDRTICSVLDLSKTQTTKGMDMLEKLFGKEITTRNWNTIEKIGALL